METGNPTSYKNLDQQIQGKKPCQASKEPLKVKYISSPVMVNAKSAAEFKAIVQELTGKDSNDDSHHHRSPEYAGSRATTNEYSQGPFIYGGTNAKLGDGADQFQGSSVMESNVYGEDVFWKLSQSLSRCEFPYG